MSQPQTIVFGSAFAYGGGSFRDDTNRGVHAYLLRALYAIQRCTSMPALNGSLCAGPHNGCSQYCSGFSVMYAGPTSSGLPLAFWFWFWLTASRTCAAWSQAQCRPIRPRSQPGRDRMCFGGRVPLRGTMATSDQLSSRYLPSYPALTG